MMSRISVPTTANLMFHTSIYRGQKDKTIKSAATSIGKSLDGICWIFPIQCSQQGCVLLCWLSVCRATNYINHLQKICEDIFVMMQLLDTTAKLLSFYSYTLFQTPFHVLLLCWGEICPEQFLQLRLNTNHVQFLLPAALEALHTCSQSPRQSIYYCSEI